MKRLKETMVESTVEVLKLTRVETDKPAVLKLRTVDTENAVDVLNVTKTPSDSAVLDAGTDELEDTVMLDDKVTPERRGETGV